MMQRRTALLSRTYSVDRQLVGMVASGLVIVSLQLIMNLLKELVSAKLSECVSTAIICTVVVFFHYMQKLYKNFYAKSVRDTLLEQSFM